MQEIFDEIKTISNRDTCSLSDHTLKFVEEVGELVREINRKTGRKIKNGLVIEQINENIKEELADSLQTLFSLANFLGVTYDELIQTVRSKNEVWSEIIKNR